MQIKRKYTLPIQISKDFRSLIIPALAIMDTTDRNINLKRYFVSVFIKI